MLHELGFCIRMGICRYGRYFVSLSYRKCLLAYFLCSTQLLCGRNVFFVRKFPYMTGIFCFLFNSIVDLVPLSYRKCIISCAVTEIATSKVRDFYIKFPVNMLPSKISCTQCVSVCGEKDSLIISLLFSFILKWIDTILFINHFNL